MSQVYANQYTNDPRRVNKTCQLCGKAFTTYRSFITQAGRPYCSMVCKIEAGRVSKRCARCRKVFTIPRSHDGDRGQGKYCSRECKKTPPDIKRKIKTAATLRSRIRKTRARGIATPEQIANRRAMWGGLCYMCLSALGTTLDHVIPLIRGGTNWPANLRPACLACNLRKGTRLLSELPTR